MKLKGLSLSIVTVAVATHEFSHYLAAKFLGIPVTEVNWFTVNADNSYGGHVAWDLRPLAIDGKLSKPMFIKLSLVAIAPILLTGIAVFGAWWLAGFWPRVMLEKDIFGMFVSSFGIWGFLAMFLIAWRPGGSDLKQFWDYFRAGLGFVKVNYVD